MLKSKRKKDWGSKLSQFSLKVEEPPHEVNKTSIRPKSRKKELLTHNTQSISEKNGGNLSDETITKLSKDFEVLTKLFLKNLEMQDVTEVQDDNVSQIKKDNHDEQKESLEDPKSREVKDNQISVLEQKHSTRENCQRGKNAFLFLLKLRQN